MKNQGGSMSSEELFRRGLNMYIKMRENNIEPHEALVVSVIMMREIGKEERISADEVMKSIKEFSKRVLAGGSNVLL